RLVAAAGSSSSEGSNGSKRRIRGQSFTLALGSPDDSSLFLPRKERMEEAGGWYHVINRGNYRKWILGEEGAKAAFEATLFEGCEKSGWLLHGFVVMDNHFHLAVETPTPNLGEGMRWLQSTF